MFKTLIFLLECLKAHLWFLYSGRDNVDSGVLFGLR